jgi:hypothetical protein
MGNTQLPKNNFEINSVLSDWNRLLEQLHLLSAPKYLTARQAEILTGIPAKTILNRSNYPTYHKGHIPSVKLTGGRKKMFERKTIDRLFSYGGKL